MTIKLLLLTGMVLLFSACSEKDYKHMYDTQHVPFKGFPHNYSENIVQSMENGENPSKRPSYEEYRQK